MIFFLKITITSPPPRMAKYVTPPPQHTTMKCTILLVTRNNGYVNQNVFAIYKSYAKKNSKFALYIKSIYLLHLTCLLDNLKRIHYIFLVNF